MARWAERRLQTLVTEVFFPLSTLRLFPVAEKNLSENYYFLLNFLLLFHRSRVFLPEILKSVVISFIYEIIFYRFFSSRFFIPGWLLAAYHHLIRLFCLTFSCAPPLTPFHFPWHFYEASGKEFLRSKERAPRNTSWIRIMHHCVWHKMDWNKAHYKLVKIIAWLRQFTKRQKSRISVFTRF